MQHSERHESFLLDQEKQTYLVVSIGKILKSREHQFLKILSIYHSISHSGIGVEHLAAARSG